MLLFGQPKSGLANPKPISIDFKKGGIIALELIVHFAALSLISTLVSGGFQWMWQTWFVECVFDLPPSHTWLTHAHFSTDSRSLI